MHMQGNTILVAGGASGIGRGLAELLCRLGNEVLVFDADPAAAQDLARANPGMRAVELDLADPWSVTGFVEQLAATCPQLNMLFNISIAFPAKHLPGLHALLEDDDSGRKLEAHRFGIQHLTGMLIPHLRKQARSAVFNVAAAPMLAPPQPRPVIDGGVHASALSVRKRWAGACVEVIDVNLPSRAERVGSVHEARPGVVTRIEFVSRVAHLLAEGLHEAAALARLGALWPAVAPGVRVTRDDDLMSEVF